MSAAEAKVRSMSLTEAVDAFFAHDQDLTDDPYPLYNRLREEAPVFRHKDKFLVSRYDDAREFLIAPDTLQGLAVRGTRFRNAAEALDEQRRVDLANMFAFFELRVGGTNGDHHTRLRKLAQHAFTPRVINAMEERIEEIANELLDRVSGRQEIELIGEFAYHLPLIVVCEMCDIPPEERDDLRVWANDLGQFVGANWSSPAVVDRTVASVANLKRSLSASFERKRGQPTTSLLTALLNAEGDGGDKFTEDELVATITQLVFAGHETSTNLMGSGIIRFRESHPHFWEEMRADASLIPGAIEELLRFEPPAQHIEKLAGRDFELRGVQLHEFDSIGVLLAAANRDPEVFESPNEFDIHRTNNPHMTFGWGPHHCIGAGLARLEAKVVFRTLLRRFPELRLAEKPYEWRVNHMLRGPERLPVVLGPDRG